MRFMRIMTQQTKEENTPPRRPLVKVPDELRWFQVKLPDDIIRRIRASAGARGLTPAQVLEQLVDQHLPALPEE